MVIIFNVRLQLDKYEQSQVETINKTSKPSGTVNVLNVPVPSKIKNVNETTTNDVNAIEGSVNETTQRSRNQTTKPAEGSSVLNCGTSKNTNELATQIFNIRLWSFLSKRPN